MQRTTSGRPQACSDHANLPRLFVIHVLVCRILLAEWSAMHPRLLVLWMRNSHGCRVQALPSALAPRGPIHEMPSSVFAAPMEM